MSATKTQGRRRRGAVPPGSNRTDRADGTNVVNATETRAVLMVRLRVTLFEGHEGWEIPRGRLVAVFGGQPGDRHVEVTHRGRRICVRDYEVDWGCASREWGPCEALVSRCYALTCARYDQPNLVDVINRRLAKMRVAWGHAQITVPVRELVVWTGNAGGDQ